jgi:hypothetical protein
MQEISGILLEKEEYESLLAIKERAEMKLFQLTRKDFDDFGGLGTDEDRTNRPAYIKCLSWLLGTSDALMMGGD